MTPADYDLLAEDPRFHDRHIELVGGKFLLQVPQKKLHQRAVSAVLEAFFGLDRGELQITTQGTTEFEENRLEPDVALVRFKDADDDRYVQRDEIKLAVEVAVSSLAYDREEKAIYYAEGDVPEYWIVNPLSRQIEVYRTPVQGRYSEAFLVLPGEMLDALCLPGIEIAADSVLPSAT